MKITKLAAGLATGLLSVSAQASNLGYTMVGINLTSTHYDDDIVVWPETFDSTAGAALYGSYQLNDNFFLMLSGQGESNEHNGVEINTSFGFFGGGFALPMGTQTDIVFRLALVSAENEVCYNLSGGSICGTTDDDGYGLGLGLRHMATQNIEVDAELTHVELNDWGNSDTVSIEGAYWFANHHSVRLSFGDTDSSEGSGTKTSAIGYRYTF